jgi:hypothetical protein
VEWRYTTAEPPPDWYKPGFDDRGWAAGKGGFGVEGTPGAIVGTRWDTSDIWARRSFTAEALGYAMAALKIHHDEDAEVYLNGEKVGSFSGFVQAYRMAAPGEVALKALRRGENVLAAHCHQTVGGQFLDVGIVVSREKPREAD